MMEVVFADGKVATGMFSASTPVRLHSFLEALQLLNLPNDQPPSTTTATSRKWENLSGQTVVLNSDAPTGEVKEIVIRQVRGLASSMPKPSGTPTPKAMVGTLTAAPATATTEPPSPTATEVAAPIVMAAGPIEEIGPEEQVPTEALEATSPVSISVDGGVIAGDIKFAPRLAGRNASAGREFAIVSVAIANFSSQARPLSSYELRLQAGDGSIVEPTVVLSAGGQMQASELAPGSAATGYLTFEIKRGDRALALLYRPLCGGACALRRLPLG